MESYYAILEIPESATAEEIRDAYRLLLQIWHPDRFHHSPKILLKAEQKTGAINVAFETLSNLESKQRYDEWLRASRGRNAQTVGTVTCPSCQTTFHSNHETYHPDTYRATEKRKDKSTSNHTAGSIPENVRMAIVAIALLFVGVIIFTFTKKSKTIVSYRPAQTEEARPKNVQVESKEREQRHAAVQDSGLNKSTQTDGKETLPRTVPKTETQLDRLELMQRQMAQAPRAPSCFPLRHRLSHRSAATGNIGGSR